MMTGHVINALSQWAMIMVLAKLLNSEAVGIFTFALAICNPVILFTNMGLRHIQGTDINLQYTFGTYMALRIYSNSAAILIIVVILFISKIDIEASKIILLMVMFKCITSFSEIYSGFFQSQEKMQYIAKSIIIRGIGSLIFLTILIYLTNSLLVGVLGLVVSALAVLVFYDRLNGIRTASEAYGIQLAENFQLNFSKKTQLNLATKALPLAFAAVLLSLQMSAPQYAVANLIGFTELGYLGVMIFMVTGINQLINALGQVAAPRLSRYFSVKDIKSYVALLRNILAIGGSIGLSCIMISVFFGGWLLTLLYTPEYAAYNELFIYVMIAGFFRFLATLLQHALVAAKNYKLIFIAHCLVFFISLFSSIYFLSVYGFEGIGYSLVIFSFSQFIILLIFVFKTIRRRQLSCS